MVEIGNAARAGQTGSSAVLRTAEGHVAAALREANKLVPLRTVPLADWLALSRHAIEPNGYFLPDWELAVDASARGRSDVLALCGRNAARTLTALLPVISAWRAFKLPLPVLVSADPYGDLATPLIDGRAPVDAARTLLAQARASGAACHRAAPCDDRGRCGKRHCHCPFRKWPCTHRAARRTARMPRSRNRCRTSCCAMRWGPRN